MKKRWKHCKINKNRSWNPCLKGTSVSPHHHPRLLVTEDQQTQVRPFERRVSAESVVARRRFDFIFPFSFFRGREAYKFCREKIRRTVSKTFNCRNGRKQRRSAPPPAICTVVLARVADSPPPFRRPRLSSATGPVASWPSRSCAWYPCV